MYLSAHLIVFLGDCGGDMSDKKSRVFSSARLVKKGALAQGVNLAKPDAIALLRTTLTSVSQAASSL